MWARWPARCQILNPQPNPQNAMSYTTSAYFGSPRGFVSFCKTYPCKPVPAEVASSSLVVPAILSKRLSLLLENRRDTQENTHYAAPADTGVVFSAGRIISTTLLCARLFLGNFNSEIRS